MCGRFAKADREEGEAAAPDAAPRGRWNIAPSALVEVIRKHPETGALHRDLLQWGLVPRWTTSLAAARKPVNARAETVRTSGMFKDCFDRRRALVPMTAFYEWAGAKPPKQPWAVARRDGEDMLVAAVWDGWRAPDGSILRTVATLTTTANATLLPIHPRMPVMIAEADIATWLGDDIDAAAALMVPAPDDFLRAWPVSRAVNSVANDTPDLLRAV